MKRNIFKAIAYTFLLCLIVSLFIVFYPRSYNVPPLNVRKSTQYWNLNDGAKIAYTLISGKGVLKPYPIIYLHGGPGDFISDRNIVTLKPLADSGYNVYLYDQVGSGESSRLENIEDYTVERHINELSEIIKNTGAKKVILIGQSWGAILATLFTAGHKEKVEKL